jgi:hypothetical protein
MFANWKSRTSLFVGVVLMAVAVISMAHSEQVTVRGEGAAGSGSRYTVIETQGFNLLVTDNGANKLYYYATDKDAPVGSAMKLRASLDLTQVGREEIKITAHNLENIRKKDSK